ncbi:MAG TPA: VCBS repeat-containing protein, partial [Candidatus Polarisedimenticolia bacterium]|nr:VCBS repeat-containing protein [Candidatus Polarisedimenticolia bacterium]
SVFAADIDGDGDLDAISASTFDSTIAWYENTDGQGSFGPAQVITSVAGGAWSVTAADVDGDGDLDVLWAALGDDTIAWSENTNGQGSFGAPQAITTSASGVASVVAADVDGDGDLDVLSASTLDATIAWYENTDGQGTFGPAQAITTSASGAASVVAADVDGDGDLDVVSASEFDDTVAWYENTDGQGSFGPKQTISSSASGATSVAVADLDRDGDLDVIAALPLVATVVWYENTDGQGSFGAAQTVTTTASIASSVYAADVDADGDLDVLCASSGNDTVAWYENTNGQGSFGSAQAITTTAAGAYSVVAADVDGDGDLDVLSASVDDDAVRWFENETIHKHGAFSWAGGITKSAVGVSSVFVADLDGDGDLDALSASQGDNQVAWYENTDGQGGFWTVRIIASNAIGASSVFAGDMDGDGDLDVVAAISSNDTVVWYENEDGQGTLTSNVFHEVTTSASGVASVFVADVDGDGDLDVLSASPNDDTIAWYENTDGKGDFGSGQAITTGASGASSVFAADVDGDGDLDVLAASANDDTIAWYENTDGAGSFGTPQPISTAASGASSALAADLD